MWDLEWELVQDVPTPAPLTRMSFEQWQKRVLESPNFIFDGQTIARDGNRYVGMSGLWTSEADPKKLYTGLTGVVRSYRRRGIATAMKVNGICFAQSKGIEVIETDNEENNPMLDLNKQLGFKEKPAFVCYEKELERIKPVKELLIEPL
jgi:RimJ/RimL family protein N-acetyltransferase